MENFEINHKDEFETFDHEVSKPLEGRGCYFSQDDLNMMVEEINHHIQKRRQFLNLSQFPKDLSGRPSAVHLVSSESAAGSLSVGLERPKIVMGFPDDFSIGPLWNLDCRTGKAYRSEWLEENINYEQEEYIYQNKLNNTLREIEDIPSQVPIYLWYGHNADEYTFILYILDVLKNKENEIYLINATELYPKLITSKDKDRQISHTGQIEPDDLRLLFEKNRGKSPLIDKALLQFQREWTELLQTKEVLRIWDKDKLKSVPENYIDSLILRAIEKLHNEQIIKDFIKTGQVIGEILEQRNMFVNIFYLEYRIRYLVYSGVLELKGVPKSMHHYSVKIRS
ncbi:DUF1835 domain-containing protein [Lysinibacillus sp. NPDC097287]|uniref:DUF1835 domain-containing protein n=1 Tax=Lysinibacillus sp. NPDC097287 TaxID=3364144 RepID=UPI00380025FA